MSINLKGALIAVIVLLMVPLYQVGSVMLADSADYTQADWLKFKLLAPDSIKSAPQLDDARVIHYRAADGNSPQVDEIEYKPDVATSALENYLISLGYRQSDDPVFGKRWVKDGSSISAFIAKTDSSVLLTFTD